MELAVLVLSLGSNNTFVPTATMHWSRNSNTVCEHRQYLDGCYIQTKREAANR